MVVTTRDKPGPGERRRAELIAARCSVPVVRRRALHHLIAEHEAVYVVGRQREALHTRDGAIHVHRGLLSQKCASGREHPMIRAIAPAGSTLEHIVDGTLGLAGDALHLAQVLDCRVDAIEAVPAVYSLAESGLRQLASELPAVRHLHLHLAETESWLAAQPDDSCDAVFLAPMFEEPEAAAPGYEAFRAVARHQPMAPSLLEQARRVARERVVVKLALGQRLPELLGGTWGSDRSLTYVNGRALSYAVVT